jgi:hypothetical protein
MENEKITAQNERYLNHISQKEYIPGYSPALQA